MLYWGAENYQWIFSGIGVLMISLAIHHWRKSERERQSNTKMDNSSLTHSTVSGLHNTQTVNATTIHAQTGNLRPVISAPAHDDLAKTQKPQRKIKRGLVASIAVSVMLAVTAVLYFSRSSLPDAPKHEPRLIFDGHGHPRASDANQAELQVIRLQDEIADLRRYKESVQYPDSRSKLKDATYLAERIMAFSDASLSLSYRYVKYEYGAFAYVDATAAAMFDDRPKVDDYASRAIKHASAALSMLDAAERAYQADENSRFLLDWVAEDNGKDRVLYLRAEAECMLGSGLL